VRNSSLTNPHDVQLVKEFEKRFPRTEALPCNPVRDYDPQKLANLEEGLSDDELDLTAHLAVDEHFGA
jgi:hypothetical protein